MTILERARREMDVWWTRWAAFYGAIGEPSFTSSEGKSGVFDGDREKSVSVKARGLAIEGREGREGQAP